MDIKLLKYDSYIQMIKNSVGTKMFQNLYLEIDGEKKDVAQNGNFSCAFFVSNLLLMWNLISEGHAIVESTIKDMEKSGWKKIKPEKIQPGDVIVWEKWRGSDGLMHLHNGFYIGNNKAISNSTTEKMPTVHHWTYDDKRKIIAVYNYNKFDK